MAEAKKKRMMVMEKKIRGDVSDSIDGSSSLILSYDILCEILSRSSAKALMRFKCVCKNWKLLIEHDQHFIQLHLSQSEKHPRLVVSTKNAGCDPDQTYFFLSDKLFEDGRTELKLTTRHSTRMHMLQPINGLICFYEMNSIRISNISTGEDTQWIETTTEKVHEDGFAYIDYDPWFSFGFDPVRKEHKVLCVWAITKYHDYEDPWTRHICEVLTVGDNRWRTVDDHGDILPNHIYSKPVYINGSIYWLNAYSPVRPDPMDEVIMVFDVGSEKFGIIRIPNFIIDEFPRELFPGNGLVELLEVDGRVALSCTGTYEINETTVEVVKLWIASTDDKKSASLNWTEDTIIMPSNEMEHNRCRYGGYKALSTSDRDLIIIKPDSPIDCISLYYYNWKTRTSRKADFTADHHHNDGQPCYRYEIVTFVESILPVRNK